MMARWPYAYMMGPASIKSMAEIDPQKIRDDFNKHYPLLEAWHRSLMDRMSRTRALHLPPGTRVIAITQHVVKTWTRGKTTISGSNGTTVYRVWLAVKCLQMPVDKWEGTYIEINPDDSMVQCTTDQPEYEVMEARS